MLVDLARGIILLDPAQELGDRGAVARLRRLVPIDFDRILHRLGQHHRIARVEDRRPRRLERLRDRRHRPLGIDRHGLAAQRSQIRLERVALVQPHAIAEVGADILADLVPRHEQVRRPVGMDHREGQSDRGVRHVGPTHIERPGDRIERRQHRRIGFLLDQPVGHFVPLLRR